MNEVEIEIGEVGARGDGIGVHEGVRVFVDGALPGERHRVRLEPPGRRGRRGHGLERLATSPDRQTPPCPHYVSCGGCVLQHWRGDAYGAWKRDRVVRALARVGLEDVQVAALRSVPPASRRRARFGARRTKDGIVVGFHARRGTHLTAIRECAVLRPELARLPALLASLLDGFLATRREIEVAATLGETGVDLWIRSDTPLHPDDLSRLADFAEAADLARLSWGSATPETLVERRRPLVRFAAFEACPPAGAFLQATESSAAQMIELTREAVGAAAHVADLFSGIGMLSLPLARRARVTAIDRERAMLEALEAAARAQGCSERVSVRTRDLMRHPLVAAELADFDAVVIDPPRAGAWAQAAALAASTVPTVLSLSCNPTTFARDARLLVDGGYRIATVTPIDQFLWSAHVELVAAFRRP